MRLISVVMGTKSEGAVLKRPKVLDYGFDNFEVKEVQRRGNRARL